MRTRSKEKSVKPKVNLKMKMILLIGFLVTGILLVVGLFLHHFITDLSRQQIGERALAVSETVARVPEIEEAFKSKNPTERIQPIVMAIQEATGAEFIVIGNKDEIRLAHPEMEKIGRKMKGEDNFRALLYGESYLSEAVGSLGLSLRAKSPIVVNDEIVGVVSVGFLANDIQSIIQGFTTEIWLVLGLVAIGAVIGAIFIATYIKKLLMNLEPEEIASLYEQREKILQSTHEGILAMDEKGIVTMSNLSARSLLGSGGHTFMGEAIHKVLPQLHTQELLQEGKPVMDKELFIQNHFIYVNALPIQVEGKIAGAVATLRNKTEIEQLSKELAYTKQYSNALRAQTHEFSNKMHTLLGLLLLDKKEEAITFIRKESEWQADTVRNLIDYVSDPFISGLLIGKLNVARELKISIIIQPTSQISDSLSEQKKEVLLTAIGNVIDNAIDEVQLKQKREIAIYFTDIGDDVVFEVEDSGEGIPLQNMPHLFTQGFSSKQGENRGYGLANVKRLLDQVNGSIYLEESELGGACFIISIPKDIKRG